METRVVISPTDFIYQLSKVKDATKIARIYLPLRHYNIEYQSGSGAIDIDLARSLCQQWGLANSIKNIIELGNGVWWRTIKNNIVFYSPVVIAQKIGLESISGHVTHLPFDVFKSLKKSKAAFFCSFLNKINTPISQETIFDITGVPVSTQKIYRKITGIDHQKNIAVYKRNGKPVKYHQKLHDIVGEERYVFAKRYNGQLVLATVIPNGYGCIYQTSFRKRLKKSVQGSNSCRAGKHRFNRVFFGNRDKDNSDPNNKSLKFYSDDTKHKKNQDVVKAIWGDSVTRVWDAVLPYDLDWNQIA